MFGRTCLEELFGASGVSGESSPIFSKRLQVDSLFQGSFCTSVPVNSKKPGLGNCRNGTETPSPY